MTDSQDLYTHTALKIVTQKEREIIKSIFTKPTEKRGAVALTIGGATTKSEEGNIFSNSKTVLDTNQFNPLHNNLKLIQGGKNGSN